MNLLTLFGDTSMYYDPNYYSTASTTNDAAAAGVFVLVMFIGLIISLICYVVFAFLMGRIFKKAGQPAWKAWVPIYNNWILFEIGGQQGFWAVLALIPVVNIVSLIFMYIAMYHVGLKLGKEGAFVLLAIFLPLVWLIWLAVDHSTWEGKVEATDPSNPTPTPPVNPAPQI